MDNEEMLAITVLIADRTYRLNIRRDEEEVVRKAAKMIEDKLNLYGNRYKVDKDERDKYLSMIALDLAVNFCKMDSEKDMEPMADKIKELNLELKKYLGIGPLLLIVKKGRTTLRMGEPFLRWCFLY